MTSRKMIGMLSPMNIPVETRMAANPDVTAFPTSIEGIANDEQKITPAKAVRYRNRRPFATSPCHSSSVTIPATLFQGGSRTAPVRGPLRTGLHCVPRRQEDSLLAAPGPSQPVCHRKAPVRNLIATEGATGSATGRRVSRLFRLVFSRPRGRRVARWERLPRSLVLGHLDLVRGISHPNPRSLVGCRVDAQPSGPA
jgi:hypothetical protein